MNFFFKNFSLEFVNELYFQGFSMDVRKYLCAEVRKKISKATQRTDWMFGIR